MKNEALCGSCTQLDTHPPTKLSIEPQALERRRMRSLPHFQMTECNGLTRGVRLVQSVPMRLVIVNVGWLMDHKVMQDVVELLAGE